jgi:hypothetical protein
LVFSPDSLGFYILYLYHIFKKMVLGFRKVYDDLKEQYECLAIANVWKELPFCLTRKPDTSCWKDFIVLADRDREKVSPAGKTRIDDLLTDWTFSDWNP